MLSKVEKEIKLLKSLMNIANTLNIINVAIIGLILTFQSDMLMDLLWVILIQVFSIAALLIVRIYTKEHLVFAINVFDKVSKSLISKDFTKYYDNVMILDIEEVFGIKKLTVSYNNEKLELFSNLSENKLKKNQLLSIGVNRYIVEDVMMFNK